MTNDAVAAWRAEISDWYHQREVARRQHSRSGALARADRRRAIPAPPPEKFPTSFAVSILAMVGTRSERRRVFRAEAARVVRTSEMLEFPRATRHRAVRAAWKQSVARAEALRTFSPGGK